MRGCREGHVQRCIDRLTAAVEKGRWIENEPRLTLGPECKFGDITARNAHMAALILGRRMIAHAVAAHESPEAPQLHAAAIAPFGYLEGMEPVNCDYDAWAEAVHSESDRAKQQSGVGAHSGGARRDPPAAPGIFKGKAVRDKLTEARDKWVYNECCKGTAYDSIARNLPKRNTKWPRISTKQGILACAKRYAKRNGLPDPPPRQER